MGPSGRLMACGCNKNKRQFEVVADGGNGKVVFTASVRSTADTVAKRYPGSIVREQAQTPARRGVAQAGWLASVGLSGGVAGLQCSLPLALGGEFDSSDSTQPVREDVEGGSSDSARLPHLRYQRW